MPLPLPVIGKLLWRYRRAIGIALAVLGLIAGFLLYRHSLIERGREEGKAEVQVLWDADTIARDKATADAIAKAEADKAAAIANNAKELEDAYTKLDAVAADRDNVDGLLKRARDQVRALAASQATGQRGIDAFAGIAARAAEVDRRLADYDQSCQRDAIRFQALQDQIRPQL